MNPVLPMLCPVVTEIRSISQKTLGHLGSMIYVRGPAKTIQRTTYTTVPSGPESLPTVTVFQVTLVPQDGTHKNDATVK